MNLLLMKKTGILFCFKLLTLVTLSIVIYVRTLGGAKRSHASKIFTVHEPLAVRSRSAPVSMLSIALPLHCCTVQYIS